MDFFFHDRPAFKEIDIETYRKQFENGSSHHILLDVREEDEFAEGHIAGAINIPLSELADRYEEIPAEQTIVLVCSKGGRSHMGAEFLVDSGYTRLYNLVDGIYGWMAAGLPLEQEAQNE